MQISQGSKGFDVGKVTCWELDKGYTCSMLRMCTVQRLAASLPRQTHSMVWPCTLEFEQTRLASRYAKAKQHTCHRLPCAILPHLAAGHQQLMPCSSTRVTGNTCTICIGHMHSCAQHKLCIVRRLPGVRSLFCFFSSHCLAHTTSASLPKYGQILERQHTCLSTCAGTLLVGCTVLLRASSSIVHK
jgi:hypothetical protein